jgi:predicted nuclease of predicted toxin-antitoxin system
MRILIDECVDPRIKQLFDAHEVADVHECGWGGLEDAPLLLMAQDSFDVFLTLDRKLEFQQNISKLRLGLLVVQVQKNQIAFYRAIRTEILAAVSEIRPGNVIHVAGASK